MSEQSPFDNPVPTTVRQIDGIFCAKWRRKGDVIFLKLDGIGIWVLAVWRIAAAIGSENVPKNDGRWRKCRHSFRLNEL